MHLAPLPRPVFEPAVRLALAEDLGAAGDITSAAVVPSGHRSTLEFRARQAGCLAGIDVAALAFELIDPSIRMEQHLKDGERLEPGALIATVEGSSHALLTAERTALNFMGHLSGVASVTRSIVDLISGTKAKLACTRKTTPGLRALEKYAVRAGGGINHRFALYDAILIKDNHIAIAGGVRQAIRSAKSAAGHMVKIEIEVDTLDQLREVLEEGVDAVLLDNMTPAQLEQAVSLVDGRALTEASGGITPQTARAIAESGVDLLSVGWITHSAPTLDIGLDWRANEG